MMKPSIQLRRVNKTFNKRKSNALHVLKDIDLILPDKGLVMLLGPSGSGKTTLLNVLGGLDNFDKGSIDILDYHLENYKSTTWDHIRNFHVGYIFQNYHLLPDLSVYDNIAYVLRLMGYSDETMIEAKVTYVLKAVNMYKFRKKNALQLSGGQQQRVAIARAIVKNPDIIIADEPTGNLDSTNTLEVMTMLKQIASKKLVLMVTHERDLANYYADRIINIEDGVIKEERVSTNKEELELKYDETIYLKDLDFNVLKQDGIEIQTYQDAQKQPVKAMLIVKNNTVFVKFDTGLKNVKILDDRSTIKIKDEFQKDSIEAKKAEITFDHEQLLLPKVIHKKSMFFSFKKSLLMALEKVFLTTRRGKIMLFSFLLSGIVVAYAASSLAAVLFLEPEANLTLPKGYVSVSKNDFENELFDISTQNTYNSIIGVLSDDGYIHSLTEQSITFIAPSNIPYSVSFYSNIDLIDHIEERNLSYGKMPSNDFEIVITKGQADSLIENGIGQDIGIWTYEHILNERIRIHSIDLKISGILDSDMQVVFVSRNLANAVSSGSYENLIPVVSYEIFDSLDLYAGRLPLDNEILVNKRAALEIGISNTTVFPFTRLEEGKTIIISGIYNDDNGPIFSTSKTVELTRFLSSNIFYVYDTNDIEANLGQVYGANDVRITNIYENALNNLSNEMSVVIVSTYTTAFIIIGIAALGFFFVIRSSLVKRQYEIAIMRAIGVYKKEILSSFLIEILVLSTVSTLIGYMVGTYGFSILSDSVLGSITLFKVNFLSVIFGLIAAYVINIIAGLFPVWRLLSKTPAQIISQYDM
jgi:putative ABC transport system permease protein